MVKMWRCDWCYELIDPIEGDEHTQLTVELRIEGSQDSITKVDLCESCRPESAQSHMDWVDYHKDKCENND